MYAQLHVGAAIHRRNIVYVGCVMSALLLSACSGSSGSSSTSSSAAFSSSSSLSSSVSSTSSSASISSSTSSNSSSSTSSASSSQSTSLRSWGAAAAIPGFASAFVTASDPEVAMDNAGNAMMVWVRSNLDLGGAVIRTDVVANYYDASQHSWSLPAFVESDNNGNVATPRVVMSSIGEAVAVWVQSNGETVHVWANRYHAATQTWGTPTQLDGMHIGNAGELSQVVTDAQGETTVAWSQPASDNSHNEIWINRTQSHQWGNAVRVDHSNSLVAAPRIADAAGRPWVVWQESISAYYRIRASHFNATNAAWSDPEAIDTSSTSGHSENPDVAVNANGDAAVMWQWSDSSSTNVVARRYISSTQSWSNEQSLTTTGYSNQPRIAIDPNGNVIAAWLYTTSEGYRVIAGRYRADTNTWGTVPIVAQGLGNALFPCISMDGSGNAFVGWQQQLGSTSSRYAYANRYRSDINQWNGEVPLHNEVNALAGPPHIAVNGDGRAIAVWEQNEDGAPILKFSRFE